MTTRDHSSRHVYKKKLLIIVLYLAVKMWLNIKFILTKHCNITRIIGELEYIILSK